MKEKIIINDIEYTILVKFTSESTNKDYIIYSTLEPKDHIIEIYSGILNNDTVEEVDTKEEQLIIDKMISTLATRPNEVYKLNN
ncbi:MAG: hypothetical protein II625_02640 [Bacilli bacterium]|nr:hypothetical protein [Bacilli bacterium]